MNTSGKAKTYFPLLAVLALGLVCSCASPTSMATPPSSNDSEGLPAATRIPDEPLGSPDRVDVVYFHRHRRCKACLYIEDHVSYVVKTYFQDEVDSGRLTLEIVDLGDNESAAIISKYGAHSPQLFTNTIRDGVDHIRHVEEIWTQGFRGSDEDFDEIVRSAIEQSLRGEEY
ncbi:MAG: hypothetical protein ISS52_03370 [Dehalococcoidia bacterium]|nr:hypothetical protein [Dehalococcoidia bacterium]